MILIIPSSLIAFSLRPKTAETAEAEVAAASSVTVPGEATWTRHQHPHRGLTLTMGWVDCLLLIPHLFIEMIC